MMTNAHDNAKPLAHVDNLEAITHADIREGDHVWNAGYLMRASNVRREIGRPNVVRYNGQILGDSNNGYGRTDLTGTGYDGGTYGAREDVRTSRLKASAKREQ